MRRILIISFFVLITIKIFPQNVLKEINFIVRASGVTDSESVFISGSDSLLGGWNPGTIILSRIDDSTWSKKFWFSIGRSIEYKFTKGSWDHEALNDDGSTPKNRILQITEDTTIFICINRWSDKAPRLNHGQIKGTLKYHPNFTEKGPKSRDVIVWLPPSYDSSLEKRYPVLYMHDGQNIVDPATSSFGYDWQVDEVADSLIKCQSIKEIIVVGIYNTPDRVKEYSHSPLGYKYMAFIVEKLKPFIDAEYRTLPDRENTAVAGSSMGGLISFMMAWCYPNIFSMSACLSPALKIREFNYVDTVVNFSGDKKDIKLYIDNGGVGIETELQPGIDEMIVALQNKGYELGKDLIWYIDSNAVHSESAWAKRIWRPLKFFFDKNNN